jgi:hypothetical protein
MTDENPTKIQRGWRRLKHWLWILGWPPMRLTCHSCGRLSYSERAHISHKCPRNESIRDPLPPEETKT